ncbi:TonB-dependent receptor plug domain-containing protein [Bisgaard Taxon 10/6]|uniref:TonB-dependent receptor plug domain-containing protein n=1 Tax=Exercitatus varius TaxID=67857 RepID=UPI00294B7FC9|nr:TonB-dependent receptor plug domain-containing protein [Exercitatus varius]MDG2948003.1 TonB-dependent receptor plug domain-containing protein [Exercitatus varius]
MRTSTRFSLSWLTLVLLPTISWAQNETELDEISVKSKLIPQNQLYSANSGNVATKVSTPLIRTPVSVTVVTEKQIQDRNAINVAESLSYTSGLVSNYRGQNNELEIMVRGIGNKSDGGGVPTYLNGIAYQGSYELDPFFLESINMIKGPASVLYGQSNPGGIVDIVTKKPTQTNKNLLQLKIGNNDYYQLGLDIDRKLNEQLAFRLIGNIKRLDWKEHYVRQQDSTLAPSLTWKPDENTEWTVCILSKTPESGGS